MDLPVEMASLSLCLDDLPEEIMQSIYSFSDAKTLSRMARVSHYHNRQVIPFLYRDIHLNWDAPHITPAVSLFFNVVTSEELQNRVRHVTITGNTTDPWAFVDDEEDDTENPLALRLIHLVAEFGESRTYPISEDLLKDLPQHLKDFLITLLLDLLPNLETLEIAADYLCSSTITNLFAQRPERFPRLHKVIFNKGTFKEELIDFEVVLPIFYLPSLKDLELTKLTSMAGGEMAMMRRVLGLGSVEWPNGEPYASSLRRLIIGSSDICEKGLLFLLKATPQLEHLEVYLERLQMEDGPFPRDISCTKIHRALHTVKGSLEHLSVGLRWYPRPEFRERDEGAVGVRGMVNLAEFPKLRHLEICPDMILGQNTTRNPRLSRVLPRSLIHLTFRNDVDHSFFGNWSCPGFSSRWESPFLSVFVEFLKEWRLYTPELKLITFMLNDPNIYGDEEAETGEKLEYTLQKYQPLCNEAELAFSVKIVDATTFERFQRRPDDW